MNATLLESHISAATAALGRNRTPSNGSGDRSGIAPETNRKEVWSTWAADYGARNETTTKAALDAARLQPDGGSYSDGTSGPKRKNRMDNRGSWSGKALWNEMIAALCPGTRNLFIGFGVLAFIVLV